MTNRGIFSEDFTDVFDLILAERFADDFPSAGGTRPAPLPDVDLPDLSVGDV